MKDMMNSATKVVPGGIGVQNLFVSFDIEKFSPGLHVNVAKAVDAVFAEAYGLDFINKLHLMQTSGKIHYVKSNFHHTVEKQGADFEGFYGRRNTIYHCAVMGYTVNCLRREGFTRKGANFCSLIDDGLLRLTVPENPSKEYIHALKHRIEEIYRNASMQISWDKTFVSGRLSVFLNEIRYMGRSITPGLKTAIRIVNFSDALCPTLYDDLQMVASTSRGAITSGAPPTAIYALYSLHVGDAIRRWGKYETKWSIYSALKLFLPVRLGGLGICGLLSLCGSLTFNDLSEALGVFRAVGFRYKQLQPMINAMLDLDIKPMDKDGSFRNPSSVQTLDTCLNVNRGPSRIKRFLLTSSKLPAIADLLEVAKAAMSGEKRFLPNVPADFPCECRERIWAATPESVIENIVAKFLRARSAMYLVPFKMLLRVKIANKMDAIRYVGNITHK